MKTKNNHMVQWGRAAIAGTLLAALAACGGGGGSSSSTPTSSTHYQVVSFGDSLSDVGTYAPFANQLGGGRFTTNPGQIWTQDVAQFYGGTLNAAFTGGFGQPLVAQSGLGYAQGGSRVTNPIGVSNAQATNPAAPADAALTTVPIVTQVQNYLSAHGSFNSSQLVLINGGANDIIFNAQLAAAGAITPTALQANVSAAATDLVGVIAQVLQAGATQVVVSNIPDIGATPLGISTPVNHTTFTGLTQLFNATLKGTLAAEGLLSKVIYIDAYTWSDGITANFQANGFTVSNTGTACNLAQLGSTMPALASSLFCSPDTYTVPGADQTYMYADTIHPTTHLHALFATYAEQRVAQGPAGN